MASIDTNVRTFNRIRLVNRLKKRYRSMGSVVQDLIKLNSEMSAAGKVAMLEALSAVLSPCQQATQPTATNPAEVDAETIRQSDGVSHREP